MYICCPHRAGTTGTMLLMHLQGKDSGSALQEARLIFEDDYENGYGGGNDDDGVYAPSRQGQWQRSVASQDDI